jgi:hypothetical protein
MLVSKPTIDVSGIQFNWDIEKGIFHFEEGEAILFWISSAMKTFFDTIEEVSGRDAAHVVLETTGFRQGAVVSEFLKNSHLSIKEIISIFPTLYASAGWGRFKFQEMNEEQKTAIIHIQDSWIA